jgi:YidC/Oxa1 family membrane protein insertase
VTVTAPAAPQAGAADSSVPTASTTAAPPGITAEAPTGATAPVPAAARVEVATDLFKLSFSTEGGSLIGAQLLQHASAQLGTEPIELLTQTADHTYIAQTGLIGGAFPTHKTPMTLMPGPTTLADGQNELQVRFESAEVGGVKLVKTYKLQRGSYVIGVRHEVANASVAPVSPQLYVQLVRDGKQTANETPFYSTFTGPAIYTEQQKFQKVDFGDIADNSNQAAIVTLIPVIITAGFLTGTRAASDGDISCHQRR